MTVTSFGKAVVKPATPIHNVFRKQAVHLIHVSDKSKISLLGKLTMFISDSQVK